MVDLFSRYARMVYAVALARLGPRDAEDVMQDVFVKAAKHIQGLRDADKAGPWLASITRTTCMDTLRNRQRESSALSTLADVTSVEVNQHGSHQTISARLEASDVLSVIHRLPEAYREPLLLRLVEGMTGPQIAGALGMTHGSVRVNLCKGMEQLRLLLGLAGNTDRGKMP